MESGVGPQPAGAGGWSAVGGLGPSASQFSGVPDGTKKILVTNAGDIRWGW